jgi:hypothetical protein
MSFARAFGLSMLIQHNIPRPEKRGERREERREKRREKKRRIEWGHVSSSERKFGTNLPPRRGCCFLLQEDD